MKVDFDGVEKNESLVCSHLRQVLDLEVVPPPPQHLNLVDKTSGLSWSLHTSSGKHIVGQKIIKSIDRSYSNVLLSQFLFLLLCNFLLQNSVFNVCQFIPWKRGKVDV